MGRARLQRATALAVVAVAIVLTAHLCSAADTVDDDPRAGLLPEALVSLGTKGSFALVVSKADSRLEVYQQFDNGRVERVATYRTSTGRGIGDKLVEGDLKTPEGIYYFVRIREDQDLPSKYGIRAFDLNYPNDIDRIESKTGYGIWLHGTDEPERLELPRTSEGCVVVSNEDLTRISDYLTLYRTPIVIGEDIAYADVSVVEKDRQQVATFLKEWLDAWSRQDLNAYISHYHEQFGGSAARLKGWTNRKKRVFSATDWAEIEVSDVKILRDRSNIVVSFFQHYASNLMDDTGIKWVYLKENNGRLSIVSEEWHPVSRVRNGSHWHQKNVTLKSVVDQLPGVALDNSGRIAVVEPSYHFDSRLDQETARAESAIESAESETRKETVETEEKPADNQAEPDENTNIDNNTEPIIKDTGVVRVENASILSTTDRNITIQFDVVNKKQTGNRRRGWVYIVANWNNGSSYTSFPQGVTTAVPDYPARGDSYGIRWFKTVEATLERPQPEAELTGVHAFVYNQNGEQIGGYEIIQQPGEVH